MDDITAAPTTLPDTVAPRAVGRQRRGGGRPAHWDALHRTAMTVREAPPGPRRARRGRRTAMATCAVLAAGGVSAAHLGTTPAAGVSAMATNDAALFALTNQDRTSNGVPALQGYSTLGAVAENRQYNGCGFPVAGRAQDMINRNYFAHVIPGCGGQLVWSMLSAAGIGYLAAGENIGWNNVTDPNSSAAYVNQMFMNSPEHRANILNPAYTHLGVGSAQTAPGQVWSGGGSPMTGVTMYAEEFIQSNGTAPSAYTPPPPAVPPPFPTGAAAVGRDGQLWALSPGVGYQPMGGLLTGAPAVAGFGPTTYYLGTGANHDVWIRTDTAPWRPLSTTPVYCVDNPAAAFDAGGRLWVACQGADRALWVTTVPAGGFPQATGWQSLGGVLGAGPSIAAVGSTMTFFALGQDHRIWTATANRGWQATTMLCNGHPAAATAAGKTYLACNGLDGALWISVHTSGGWNPAFSAGGHLVNGPAVAAATQGALFLVEGGDRAVWQILMSPSGSLDGWQWNGGVVQDGAGGAALPAGPA